MISAIYKFLKWIKCKYIYGFQKYLKVKCLKAFQIHFTRIWYVVLGQLKPRLPPPKLSKTKQKERKNYVFMVVSKGEKKRNMGVECMTKVLIMSSFSLISLRGIFYCSIISATHNEERPTCSLWSYRPFCFQSVFWIPPVLSRYPLCCFAWPWEFLLSLQLSLFWLTLQFFLPMSGSSLKWPSHSCGNQLFIPI